jgi:hypothetical protein
MGVPRPHSPDRPRQPLAGALAFAFALLLPVLVAGCSLRGAAGAPLAQELVPVRPEAAAPTLVVVLPGRRDSIASMQRAGVPAAIQSAWPQADVLLVGLTLAHFRAGDLAGNLQRQVIEPARRRGVRELWVVGASLGGMAAVLHDRDYPGAADGIVLLAPWLGDRALQQRIAAAGGLARWPAGPARAVDADTFQQEAWRHLQALAADPEHAGRLWLGVGDGDRLRDGAELLAAELPPAQVRRRPGGHRWSVWTLLLADLLAAGAPAAAPAVR